MFFNVLYGLYFILYFTSEKVNDVPNRLAVHLSKKQYLHATQLLVDAVSLGKDMLDGVESLKEHSQELDQKKEVFLDK